MRREREVWVALTGVNERRLKTLYTPKCNLLDDRGKQYETRMKCGGGWVGWRR